MLDTVATPDFRARAERLAQTLRPRLDAIAAELPCRRRRAGLGPMIGLELCRTAPKAPAPELASATLAAAREAGLLLLTCGLHGNVIRLLPPVTIGPEDLGAGLDALELALRRAAGA